VLASELGRLASAFAALYGLSALSCWTQRTVRTLRGWMLVVLSANPVLKEPQAAGPACELPVLKELRRRAEGVQAQRASTLLFRHPPTQTTIRVEMRRARGCCD
jgi:hypothetical protein